MNEKCTNEIISSSVKDVTVLWRESAMQYVVRATETIVMVNYLNVGEINNAVRRVNQSD